MTSRITISFCSFFFTVCLLIYLFNFFYYVYFFLFFLQLYLSTCVVLTMNFNSWNWFWSVCFGVTAVVIIISNSLSIAVLVKRRFRKRSLYLLIDLAIADLLVGLFAVPIFIIVVISEGKLVPRTVLDGVDMFTGLSSIFTLTVISLERLFAIRRPLRHRQLSSHNYVIAIATPWILSLAVTSVRVLQHYSIVTHHQFLTVIITSLSTPLLVTCTSYCVIWSKQNSRIQNGVRARRESRLSKTLFLITGTFVLTWLPFQVLVVIANTCLPCRKMHVVVIFVFKLLHYSNSFINFVIYCLRMPDYRKAVAQIFFIRKCRVYFNNREVNSSGDSGTSIELTQFSRALSLYNVPTTHTMINPAFSLTFK